jgi:uncharacterized protein
MSVAPESASLRERQLAFTAHIRDPHAAPLPGDVDARRMAIYTSLFFNNIESLLAANFPVIRALHDEAGWHALVRDFYATHRSHTPLFTEIAREFIRHLERRAQAGIADPPYLVELAHYEWSELALTLDENDLAQVEHDPHGDVLNEVPVMSPLTRVLAYRFPVHRIGPDFRPDTPGTQPTLILLTRGRDDNVHFLEIDALTALLVERLQANRIDIGRVVLETLLHELDRGDDGALATSGQAIFARLRERDAILGTVTRSRPHLGRHSST